MKAKSNADPKPRPLSSAPWEAPWTILVFVIIHLKVSPEVEFRVSLYQSPLIPKEDSLDILLWYCIDNEHFTFLLRSSSGASPRLSRWKFRTVRMALLALTYYAREPGHCCAGNYCRSRKKDAVYLCIMRNKYDGARGNAADYLPTPRVTY
jgi:hypothetical protein